MATCGGGTVADFIIWPTCTDFIERIQIINISRFGLNALKKKNYVWLSFSILKSTYSNKLRNVRSSNFLTDVFFVLHCLNS